MGLFKLIFQPADFGILFTENGFELFLHPHILLAGFKSFYFVFRCFEPYS